MGIGAALIGAGGSLASSLLNWKHDFDVMDYQHYLQSPEVRLHDMQAAGINPNAAIGGIAGSLGPSTAVSTPMSNPGAAAVDAYRNVMEANVAPSVSRKNNAEAEGQENENIVTGDNEVIKARKQMIIETKDKMVADRRISQANADVAEAYAQYAGTNAYNDALIKYQQHENLVKEWHEMNKRIDEMDENIRKMQSEETVNYAQADLMAEQENTEKYKQRELNSAARKNNAEAYRTEQKNKFWDDHGYDPDSPLDVAYRNQIENGKEKEAGEMLGQMLDFTREVNKSSAEGTALGTATVFDPNAVDIYELRKDEKTLDSIESGMKAELDRLKKSGDRKAYTEYLNEYRKFKEFRKTSPVEIAKHVRSYNERQGRYTWLQRIAMQFAGGLGSGVGIGFGAGLFNRKTPVKGSSMDIVSPASTQGQQILNGINPNSNWSGYKR